MLRDVSVLVSDKVVCNYHVNELQTGWTMQVWTSRHDETGVDNAGVDNVARRSKGTQRVSGQGGTGLARGSR